MITEAQIVSTGLLPPRVPPHDPPPGDLKRILTGRDIVRFGLSPRRYRLTEPELDPPRPSSIELGYAAALAGEQLDRNFVRRPDMMDALRNVCPKCGSRSPAHVCRTCGVARRNAVVRVPFNTAVPECAQWVKGYEDQGRVTVTGHTYDAGQGIAAGLFADSIAADLKACSDPLVLIRGTWHDLPSGTDIPVEALIDFVPRDGSEWDQCLCSVDLTPDVTPNAWARLAQNRGLHIRAALAQMLHAAAIGQAREKHLWLLVETTGGHMTGRRQAAAETLHEGRSALQNLMSAYATCVGAGAWPAFDPPPEARVNAFTEVHLEPSMINPNEGGAGYFAVSATRSTGAAASTQPLAPAHEN